MKLLPRYSPRARWRGTMGKMRPASIALSSHAARPLDKWRLDTRRSSPGEVRVESRQAWMRRYRQKTASA